MATNVTLPDELARPLEEIAQRENRSLVEVVASLYNLSSQRLPQLG
jgi:hypothetical protein